MEETKVQSLTTGIHVLRAFAAEGATLSVSEVCDKTELNKSHVSKILRVLCDSGLVARVPQSRKFEVGPDAFILGTKFVNIHPLSRAALPLMRRLALDTGHSCTLSVIQHQKLFHLLSVEGSAFVESRWQVGREIPLHTSAAGRVLLAFTGYSEMVHLISKAGLPRLTPHTITDLDEFKDKVSRVRRQGYAATRGEGTPGLGAIAVPIVQADISVAGALAVIFPQHLIPPGDSEAAMLQPLYATARDISLRLGAHVYPYGS